MKKNHPGRRGQWCITISSPSPYYSHDLFFCFAECAFITIARSQQSKNKRPHDHRCGYLSAPHDRRHLRTYLRGFRWATIQWRDDLKDYSSPCRWTIAYSGAGLARFVATATPKTTTFPLSLFPCHIPRLPKGLCCCYDDGGQCRRRTKPEYLDLLV